MANVSIKFNGKEFLLSCEDGQEEHLEELLIQINQKFNNLKNDLGNLGENKLLLITAVKVMDEYYETKKKNDEKKEELKNLSNKFKELKSLIYEYRDNKEQEILQLNNDHNKLKDEIEMNQKTLPRFFRVFLNTRTRSSSFMIYSTTNLSEIHPNWALTLNDSGQFMRQGGGPRTQDKTLR